MMAWPHIQGTNTPFLTDSDNPFFFHAHVNDGTNSFLLPPKV